MSLRGALARRSNLDPDERQSGPRSLRSARDDSRMAALRSNSNTTLVCIPLEALRQAGEKRTANAELRVADTDPGSVADLVDLVEQVENVEAQLHALVPSGLYRLNDTEVHLLIARQAIPVRNIARVGGPKSATGGEVGGKKSTGCRHS